MFLQNLNNENHAKTFHQKNRRRRDDWDWGEWRHL